MIVSMWDSKASLDASEQGISGVRGETLAVTGAELVGISTAEVLRDVRERPSRVGTMSRAVLLGAPESSLDQLIAFYDGEAVPRLKAQPGFLGSRLIRAGEGFAAVSHWADAAALEASEATSASLRTGAASTVPGMTVQGVQTSEIVFIELPT